MIVSAGSDGTASVFDVKTRQTILPPLEHVEWLPPGRSVPPVFAVAFSPDGQRVATGGTDEMIRIWSVADGRPLSTRMEHGGQVRRVSFSPDGRFIVSVGLNGTVRFWDSHTGRSEAMLDLHTSAMQAVFDSDARRVAIVGFGGEVRVWHLTPPAPMNVGRAAMSGNGERYVTFSANEFRVWNASNDMALTPPREAGGIIVTGICNWTGERVVVRLAGEQPDSELVHVFEARPCRSSPFQIRAGAGGSMRKAPDC
jgi:WD40 repeat protein